MARPETPLAHIHHSRYQSLCSPRAIVVAVAAEDAGNTTAELGAAAGSRAGPVWGREGQLGERARVMSEDVVVAAVVPAAVVDMLEWVVA